MPSFFSSAIKQFEYYKLLGDKSFDQLTEKELLSSPSVNDNSIAVMVNHIAGNMISRWTNFLTEDGEKEWRNRDNEFEEVIVSKEQLLVVWEKGWSCLFAAVKPLNDDQLEQIIHIRNQVHTVTEAINRQLCHYSYHVGQIVFLAKMIKGQKWKSLSIAKGTSKAFNDKKFSSETTHVHFTEEYLDKKK